MTSEKARLSGKERLAAAVGSALLAVALLAAGLFACCLPVTTEALAPWAEDAGDSPYTAEQLQRLARAARDYTVDLRPEGDQAALAKLDAVQAAEALAASENPAKRDRWTLQAREAAALCSGGEDGSQGEREGVEGAAAGQGQGPNEAANGSGSASTAAAASRALAAVSDHYALDVDAISHLDDCNRLITAAALPLGLCAAGAVALGLALGLRGRRRALGWMLALGPAVMAAALAALALWAAVDFMGFFHAFHGLFFPQGNWTFAIDSLLITMYPTNFWMGMGAVWAVTTLILSILCLGFGIRLVKWPAHTNESD